MEIKEIKDKDKNEMNIYKKQLANLIENSDVKIIDLNKSKNIKLYDEYLKILSLKEENREKFDALLIEEFRPSIIEEGTLGAFLFGCSQGTYGDINSNCSPLCTEEINTCEYQIWSYNKDTSTFRQINPSHVGKGFIFVDEDFVGFTKEEIKNFKAKGLLLAQVLRTRYGKHYIIQRFGEVNNLPLRYELLSNSQNKIETIYYNYATELIGVFLLLIILFFLIISSRR